MIYVLDTNVISEMMKQEPDPAVFAWIGSVPLESLYTTAITQTELLFGIMKLPRGKRRDGLIASARELLENDYDGHVLPFDQDAAIRCAEIRAGSQATGKPIMELDSMIAGIARAHDATIATRDSGFDNCGVPVIDPWTHGTRQ